MFTYIPNWIISRVKADGVGLQGERRSQFVDCVSLCVAGQSKGSSSAWHLYKHTHTHTVTHTHTHIAIVSYEIQSTQWRAVFRFFCAWMISFCGIDNFVCGRRRSIALSLYIHIYGSLTCLKCLGFGFQFHHLPWGALQEHEDYNKLKSCSPAGLNFVAFASIIDDYTHMYIWYVFTFICMFICILSVMW